jgi:IMP dehydrogenase/GMP reductase
MLIARWESKSGKYWVEVTRKEWGVSYEAPRATGSLGKVTDTEALEEMQKRVDMGYFQPDANKIPMKRVA